MTVMTDYRLSRNARPTDATATAERSPRTIMTDARENALHTTPKPSESTEVSVDLVAC